MGKSSALCEIEKRGIIDLFIEQEKSIITADHEREARGLLKRFVIFLETLDVELRGI
jgi:hypothetical protein